MFLSSSRQFLNAGKEKVSGTFLQPDLNLQLNPNAICSHQGCKASAALLDQAENAESAAPAKEHCLWVGMSAQETEVDEFGALCDAVCDDCRKVDVEVMKWKSK